MNPCVFGIIASILSSVSFVPQVIKVYRERSANDISTLTFLAITIASCLWIAHGVTIADWPLIITNVIVAALSSAMLLAKRLFRAKKGGVA
jgi:MtN3 and saliva related transmembrane protein